MVDPFPKAENVLRNGCWGANADRHRCCTKCCYFSSSYNFVLGLCCSDPRSSTMKFLLMTLLLASTHGLAPLAPRQLSRTSVVTMGGFGAKKTTEKKVGPNTWCHRPHALGRLRPDLALMLALALVC